MDKGTLGRATVLTVGGIILSLNTIAAQAAVTTLLVGPSTPVPSGQVGDAFEFLSNAAIQGDTFAFAASEPGLHGLAGPLMGLYRGSLSTGNLSVIVDRTVNSAETGLPFQGVFRTDIDGDTIAFLGASTTAGGVVKTGIYTQLTDGGAIFSVASADDPIRPNEVRGFAVEGSTVAFQGVSSTNPLATGIYTTTTVGGAPVTVVDTTTAVPNAPGMTFTDFEMRNGGLDNGTIAFLGTYPGGEGVYTVTPGGAPVAVATLDTVFPRSGGQLAASFFEPPAIDNGEVAFSVRHPEAGDPVAIYLASGGPLSLFVDTGTVLTSDGELFSTVGLGGANAGFALDNGRMAAIGLAQTVGGVFVADGTPPALVMGVDDAPGVPGNEVIFLNILEQSFSGDHIISAGFTLAPGDSANQPGIFLTTIPEPATFAMGLAGMGIGLLSRRARRT